MDIALRYDGKYGNFPEKQKFLGSVGLSGNHDYCAAFVSYVLTQSEQQTGRQIDPKIRSGRALDFAGPAAININRVYMGHEQITKGDIIIYRHSSTAGHTGISTANWNGLTGPTIEANTSHPDHPDIRGVFRKTRDVHPGSYFRPRYIRKVYTN